MPSRDLQDLREDHVGWVWAARGPGHARHTAGCPMPGSPGCQEVVWFAQVLRSRLTPSILGRAPYERQEELRTLLGIVERITEDTAQLVQPIPNGLRMNVQLLCDGRPRAEVP